MINEEMRPTITRRGFLKGMVAAGAGVVLAGCGKRENGGKTEVVAQGNGMGEAVKKTPIIQASGVMADTIKSGADPLKNNRPKITLKGLR